MERLKQLRLIDEAKRTTEEQKELQRLATAKTRAKKPNIKQWAKIIEIGAACDTVGEFHEANLRNVDAEQLKNWLELQECVADQLHWMAHWREQDASDPDYVSLDEGWTDLKNFIEAVGFIKDGFDYRSEFLKSFKPDWSIWNDKDRRDPIWGALGPYFKNAELLTALCGENEATKVRALYGLRIGIPEYHYGLWCQDITAKTAVLLAG